MNNAAFRDAFAAFAQVRRTHGVVRKRDLTDQRLVWSAIDVGRAAMLPFAVANSLPGEASIEPNDRDGSTFIIPEHGAAL